MNDRCARMRVTIVENENSLRFLTYRDRLANVMFELVIKQPTSGTRKDFLISNWGSWANQRASVSGCTETSICDASKRTIFGDR